MSVKFSNLIILLSFLMIAACKPDPLPIPFDEEPIFKASGFINNENAFNIEVGHNDYYMNSYFSKDSFDIFSFSGSFKTSNSTTDTEELTITLRDRKITKDGDNFIRDLSFTSGDFPYARLKSNPGIEDSQTLAFYPGYIFDYNQVNEYLAYNLNYKFKWVFNDIDTTSGPLPIYRFPAASGQTVQLTVSDLIQDCEETYRDTIHVTSEQGCPRIVFSYDNNFGGPISFILHPSNVISSDWAFGDNQFESFGSNLIVFHEYDTPGTYEVCVDVEFDFACPPDRFCTQVQSHMGLGCAAGYYYIEPWSLHYYNFSDIIIDWTSSEGIHYSSLLVDNLQPQDSYFSITEIQPYLDDLDGEKTVKAIAQAKVTLYNVDDPTDIITLELQELSFAMAYPDI